MVSESESAVVVPADVVSVSVSLPVSLVSESAESVESVPVAVVPVEVVPVLDVSVVFVPVEVEVVFLKTFREEASRAKGLL